MSQQQSTDCVTIIHTMETGNDHSRRLGSILVLGEQRALPPSTPCLPLIATLMGTCSNQVDTYCRNIQERAAAENACEDAGLNSNQGAVPLNLDPNSMISIIAGSLVYRTSQKARSTLCSAR